MTDLVRRDVDYDVNGTVMRGILTYAPRDAAGPAVLLIHDAFGLGAEMLAHADALAADGYVVFAADVWGERLTPSSPADIGPLIAGMATDRPLWLARIGAAHDAARQQPEVDADAILMLGYCFGGSSALEYVRAGADVCGVMAIHPGLDLIGTDWSAARATVATLISLGLSDPMATPAQRAALEAGLTQAGIDAEFTLYTHTTHAFTSLNARNSPQPEAFAYHPRNAQRAWAATVRFLGDVFPGTAARLTDSASERGTHV